MKEEALKKFFEEAWKVKERFGRFAFFFKGEDPERMDNQMHYYRRMNRIPSVTILLQFENHIDARILYNVMRYKETNRGMFDAQIEQFFGRHAKEIVGDNDLKKRKLYKRLRFEEMLLHE